MIVGASLRLRRLKTQQCGHEITTICEQGDVEEALEGGQRYW